MATESVNGNPMITDEERERLKKRLTKEKQPATREASGHHVKWDDLFNQLGQPFDSTRVPLSKLHQMRRDPMIAFGLLFVKVPLIRAPWYIKAHDKNGPRPDVSALIDGALREIYSRFIFQYCNSLDFGYQGIVKRFKLADPGWRYMNDKGEEKLAWDEGPIKALVWDVFQALPPELAYPHWTKKGEFNGINYSRGDEKDQGTPDVPLDWALWATNEKDSVFGSLWGYPRTAYAYPFWWSYWFRWALADRHFEKDADPAMIVWYPPEEEGFDANGDRVDYQQQALTIGEQLRSGSTAAFPSTLVEGVDGRQSQLRQWGVEILQNVNNFAAFNDSFSYLDVAKLRAIMVPEQAFLEGRGGTSSRNVAETLGDVFFSSQAVLMEDLDSHINRYLIPQIITANYTPDEMITAEKVTRGFQQTDLELGKQVIQLVGQSDPSAIEVDFRELLQQYGLPLTNAAQKSKKEADLDAQAAQMLKQQDTQNKPQPVVDQAAGVGVNQMGLYFTPREVIELSSELPKVKQFEDDDVVKLIGEFRTEWSDLFDARYKAVAEGIEETADALELGVTDKVKKILDKMLATPDAMARATDRVAGWITSVMDIAGRRELGRIKVDDAMWDMDNPEVQNWANQRAANLVRRVDQTTRDDLRKHLTRELSKTQTPAEIADGIRSKFAQWPSWKADRLARTEAAMAYNYATLLAYKDAGIQQVIAHDAAIPANSDPDCIERDGKVFDIDDAFHEQLKEHPNGTLGWSPVMAVPKIEVALVDSIPTGELATFDDDTGQLTIVRSIAPEQRRDFVQAVRARVSIVD